jgi:hypothetical protein
MMQTTDTLPPDIGTVERPFFLGGGRIALRRRGTWRVGATRLVMRQAGAAGGTGMEQPWSPASG